MSKCRWYLYDDLYDVEDSGWVDVGYTTSCGKTLIWPEDTATENGYKFCPFCGATIEDDAWEIKDGDDVKRRLYEGGGNDE